MTAFPAIYAEGPSPHVSDKYVFIDTRELINNLEAGGFKVTDARQLVPRSRDLNYAKHMLRFRPVVEVEVNGVVPEIVVTNSHDTYAGFSMFAGLYRFICSNGMVIGQDLFRMQARHRGNAKEIVDASVKHMTEEIFPKLNEKVERWSKIELTKEQKLDFANRATVLRKSASYTPPELFLQPRRAQDEGDDLWTVFNIVQEHLIKGGVTRTAYISHRHGLTRPINAIDKTISVNRGLWEIAEEFANAA